MLPTTELSNPATKGTNLQADVAIAAAKAYLGALNKLLAKEPGRREQSVAERAAV